MPRGGRRPGAGRKPTLDPETVEIIRRDCESRASQIQQKQAAVRHRQRMLKRGVVWGEDGEPNPVHVVPLKYRQAVIQYGIDNTTRKIPESLPEEVKYAIDTMRTNKKATGRLYSEPIPRLYRGRAAIIAQVADDWGISQRTVRTIWESSIDV